MVHVCDGAAAQCTQCGHMCKGNIMRRQRKRVWFGGYSPSCSYIRYEDDDNDAAWGDFPKDILSLKVHVCCVAFNME